MSNRPKRVSVTEARVTGSPVIGKPPRGILKQQWVGHPAHCRSAPDQAKCDQKDC